MTGDPSVTATKPVPDSHPPGAPWWVADAARYLGVSERHVRRLADDGRVKTIRIGRRLLLPDSEVARLAAEGC